MVQALTLVVPGEGQWLLRVAVRLLVLGAEPWPADMDLYCSAAIASASRRRSDQRSGAVWWHRWGPEPESAAAALAEAMTPAERLQMVQGNGWTLGAPRTGAYVGNTPAVPRLDLPALQMQDAGQGFRTMDNRQVGQVTSWPSALALAATWDRRRVRSFGEALAREMRTKGANVVLGPGLNVHRVPRNGRNAEYLSGECPYLGAALATEYVTAVQRGGVAAVAKHFVANHQESSRMTTSADISDRVLHEVYYPPYQAAVDAGVAAVMCGYNKVNGSHACGNQRTLVRHLKGSSMHFRGFVVSDWWAVHATTAAVGGVDQVCSTPTPS